MFNLRKHTTKASGDAAELLACKYLTGQNLQLVTQNFRAKTGEIDLIFIDDDTLVFVEVRKRTNRHFGGAAETVTATKQKKIIKTAAFYLLQHTEYKNHPCRFDVIGYDGVSFDWIKGAFS